MRSLSFRFALLGCLAVFAPQALRAQAVSPSATASPIKISEGDLNKHAFRFDVRDHPKCTISGPEGPCSVEAFVFGEINDDVDAYGCNKLSKATYVGHCVKGMLEGFSVVMADGKRKESPEAYISYFHKGQIAYPALTSRLTGDLNWGIRAQDSSYGCVYYGKWDQSQDRCKLFIKIYGQDFFTSENAQRVRDGKLDLDLYGTKFADFFQKK